MDAQKLDHIASHLQLSSDTHEKVSKDKGFSKLPSLHQSLKLAENYLRELDLGDLNLPEASERS